jgi:hypothetical protein
MWTETSLLLTVQLTPAVVSLLLTYSHRMQRRGEGLSRSTGRTEIFLSSRRDHSFSSGFLSLGGAS